jgi:hypothetical protein
MRLTTPNLAPFAFKALTPVSLNIFQKRFRRERCPYFRDPYKSEPSLNVTVSSPISVICGKMR